MVVAAPHSVQGSKSFLFFSLISTFSKICGEGKPFLTPKWFHSLLGLLKRLFSPGTMSSLLIFLIASASSLSFAAAAETVHNATNVTTVGWVSDGDNKRSTISLLYSCLFTIFLCTWSAMHLSVPGERDTPLRVFWRKCRWMIIGLLAPEFVAFIAISEWNAARMLVQNVRMKSQRAERCWIKLT